MPTPIERRNLLVAALLATVSMAAAPIGHSAAAETPPAPATIDATVNRSNLVVADLDRSLQIYRDILGFKVDVMMPVRPDSYMYDIFKVDRAAKMRLAFLSGADQKFGSIGLTEIKGARLPATATGTYPSTMIVETKTRFDAIYEGIRAAHLEATQIYELQKPVRREFIFTDPDGHRVLIMQLRAAE